MLIIPAWPQRGFVLLPGLGFLGRISGYEPWILIYGFSVYGLISGLWYMDLYLRIMTYDYDLWIMDYDLWIMVSGLWIMIYGFGFMD